MERMLEWNSSFKSHHLPGWLGKKVRLRAISKGDWVPGMATKKGFLPDFFDHWGSVDVGHGRYVVVQPFGHISPEKIERWCGGVGCVVVRQAVGVWSKDVQMYLIGDPASGVGAGFNEWGQMLIEIQEAKRRMSDVVEEAVEKEVKKRVGSVRKKIEKEMLKVQKLRREEDSSCEALKGRVHGLGVGLCACDRALERGLK